MRQKENCSLCNNSDFLLVTPSGELLCRHCNKVKEVDVSLTEIFAQSEHRHSIFSLDSQLTKLDNLNTFFIGTLLYHEGIISNIINSGHYPPTLPYKIVQLHFLQEYLYLNREKFNLEITEVLIKNFDRVDWDKIFNQIESLFPYLLKAMQYTNYERDKLNNALILAEWDSNRGILLTTNKYFFITPAQVAIQLYQNHIDFFQDLHLDCKGYSTSILSNNSRVLQTWNSSALFYTHLVKYSERYIFSVSKLPEVRNWLLSLQLYLKYTEETPGYFHYYNDLRLIEPFMNQRYKEIACKECVIVSKNRFHQETLKIEPQTEEFFLQCIEEWESYFSQPNEYRQIFFHFQKFTIFSHKMLELYEEMLTSQIKIQKEKMGRTISRYRAIDNLEHNIWSFGFHFNLNFLWDNFLPMMNIEFPSPNGNQEIDVVFSNGKFTDVIECKSEIAINTERLYGHYRKLEFKREYIKQYLSSKSVNTDNLQFNLLSQVCIFLPKNDINVFISETHLISYLIKKYGLYEWNGDNFFDKYPILGRIGWENIYLLEEQPKTIKNMKSFSNVKLTVGWFKSSTMKIIHNHMSQIQIVLNKKYIDHLEKDQLPVLILYENDTFTIIDFLILPPYYDEMHTDENCIFDSYTYHETKYGQRFLEIGVKNGIFGFCPKCKSIPLIPFGFYQKPHHSSARAICIRCGSVKDNNQFDAISFSENLDLIKRMKSIFLHRFKEIDLTF